MHGIHGRRLRIGAVILLALTIGVCGEVNADIPASANSRSLGIPPVFLEHPSLVFEFPAAATRFEPQLLGFSQASGSGDLGGGAILQSGGSRFFLLSQPLTSWGRGSSAHRYANLFQVGWATAPGRAHVGGAVRGAVGSLRNESESANEHNTQDRSSKSVRRMVEGSLGFGLMRDALSLDVAVAARFEDVEAESRSRSIRDSILTEESSRLDTHTPLWFTLSVRTVAEVGDESQMIVTGRWGNGDRTWYSKWEADGSTQHTEIDTDGRMWSAGVSFETRTTHVDWLSAFAHYGDHVDESVDFQGTGYAKNEQTTRVAMLGLSLKKMLTDWLRLHAGARKTYEFDRSVSRFEYSDFTGSYRRRDEAMADYFSWGVASTWRSLHLVGSMDATLDLEEVFLALDVGVIL